MHKKSIGSIRRYGAFVLLASVFGAAHAASFPAYECPQGQQPEWHYHQGQGGQILPSCNGSGAGTVHTSPDSCFQGNTQGQCFNSFTVCYQERQSIVQTGGSNPYAEYTATYRVYRKDNGGDAYAEAIITSWANFRRECTQRECKEANGTNLGLQSLASYNRMESTACLKDCVVTRVAVMDFSAGETAYEWRSTGAPCVGQTRTATSPDACRTIEPGSTGPVTACVKGNQKDLISDGKRPNDRTPEPGDFEYSGTDAESLRDEGCVVAESGRVLCISNAPSNVRPDNGTPNTPALPDATVVYNGPYGIANTSSTTVHIYNSLTVISSTNYGTGSPPRGDGQGPSNNDGRCDYGENSNSPDCRYADGDGDGDGDGEGGGDCDPATETCSFGEPGTDYNFGDWAEEIEEAETDLTAAINGAMAEASSMFTSIPGGAMALPCPPPVMVMGAEISFCMTQYEGALSDIRLILLLLGAILVIAILLR